MAKMTRREVLRTGLGGAAGLVVSNPAGKPSAAAQQTLSFKPEAGASLRVLRWSQFVQGDMDLWLANTRKFTETTGIPIRVDTISWEDLRPKEALAADIGSGPDIILGWSQDPHLFPDKLVDLTDLATYLGEKYGGWYPLARTYGMHRDRWIGLPLGTPASCMNYRISALRRAGFETFPRDTDGFLKLCRGLHRIGKPPGFALGNAIGDANAWCHWVLWSFGGKAVDQNNNVVLASPETVAALEYARELYATFIPGTLSWLDPSNNKAFLDDQIGLTANGISIYYAAKRSSYEKLRTIAEDMDHAIYPIGPVGRSTELHGPSEAMVFSYSRYPDAAKEYLRFMWEREQYEPWQAASIGYISQPLRAYADNPVWTADPKHTPFRDAMDRSLYSGYAGSIGYASAATLADYIVVNMVAEAASGEQTVKEAALRAQHRAERYYRV